MVMKGQRSEREQRALRAANGVDLAAERLARWMGGVAMVVVLAVVASIALR